MFIVGLVIFSTATQQFINNLNSSNSSTSRVTLSGHSFSYSIIDVNTTSVLIVNYLAGNAVNFYLANATAFASLKQGIDQNKTLLPLAANLSSNGIVTIIRNASSGTYPYQPGYTGLFPQPYLIGPQFNQSAPYVPPGNYYAIFENLGSINNNITAFYTQKPESSGAAVLLSINPLNILGALALIASILLAGYSLIAKSPEQKKEVQKKSDRDIAIEKEYSSIAKEQARRMGIRPTRTRRLIKIKKKQNR